MKTEKSLEKAYFTLHASMSVSLKKRKNALPKEVTWEHVIERGLTVIENEK